MAVVLVNRVALRMPLRFTSMMMALILAIASHAMAGHL